MNFGILRHVQLVYPKPDRTGEWGMGNGGFFDSLTIWLDKKIAHRVLLKIFKKENKKCCC